MGFGDSGDSLSIEEIKSTINKEIKKHFKPEFLNRIDDIIIFHALGKKHLLEIIDIELEALLERLKTKHFDVTVDLEVKEFLIDKGFDRTLGARPMRRAIQNFLEDPLATAILKAEPIGSGKEYQIHIHMENGKIQFSGI